MIKDSNNKTTLVLGASGATGRHLVAQLLEMGQNVKVIVRSPEKLPTSWKNNKRISIINAEIAQISIEEMATYLHACNAVASCLGHNLTLKGLFGKPRRLVTEAVKLTCNAISKNEPDIPIKFVLMNTTGNRNRGLDEPVSFGQKVIFGLISLLLPPQADNEQAAEYLRTKIGLENKFVEWVAVRPDSLIDEDKVSKYEVHPSPIRSALFDPGKTSRINVGHIMASLINDDKIWNKWKGQMPVLYNKIL